MNMINKSLLILIADNKWNIGGFTLPLEYITDLELIHIKETSIIKLIYTEFKHFDVEFWNIYNKKDDILPDKWITLSIQ